MVKHGNISLYTAIIPCYTPIQQPPRTFQRSMTMGTRTADKLNLKQAQLIRNNQYRSSDNLRDYQAEEVDARIHFLQSRKDALAIKMLMKNLGMAEILAAKAIAEGIGACDDWMNQPEEYITCSNGFSRVLVPSIIMEF
jgi:hypothetical protein